LIVDGPLDASSAIGTCPRPFSRWRLSRPKSGRGRPICEPDIGPTASSQTPPQGYGPVALALISRLPDIRGFCSAGSSCGPFALAAAFLLVPSPTPFFPKMAALAPECQPLSSGPTANPAHKSPGSQARPWVSLLAALQNLRSEGLGCGAFAIRRLARPLSR
jgi:hypothetical protein